MLTLLERFNIAMQIKGHVFYVTGGASGLGAATASHLHSLGGYVAIMDLQLEAGEELASSLNSSAGGGVRRAAAFEVDVCSEDQVQAAIDGCDRLWPQLPVGGCVNCGGVGMAGKIINPSGEPFDLDTFRKTVDINLVGTFNVSRLTAARLVRDLPKPIPAPTESTPDLGVIINTASAAALEGQAGQCPYSASKGGVLSLTLPMARDLAWFGIRVMTLVPSLFETPMMAQLPTRARNAILRTCEFPARFGHPHEFALSVQAIVENSMLVRCSPHQSTALSHPYYLLFNRQIANVLSVTHALQNCTLHIALHLLAVGRTARIFASMAPAAWASSKPTPHLVRNRSHRYRGFLGCSQGRMYICLTRQKSIWTNSDLAHAPVLLTYPESTEFRSPLLSFLHEPGKKRTATRFVLTEYTL